MAKTISSLNTTLTANAGPFSAAFRQAETAARSFGSTVTGAAESASSALSGIASAGSWITDLASPMAAVAGGMAIFSVATWGLGKAFDALKGGIVLAAQLEQTGVAFETIFHLGHRREERHGRTEGVRRIDAVPIPGAGDGREEAGRVRHVGRPDHADPESVGRHRVRRRRTDRRVGRRVRQGGDGRQTDGRDAAAVQRPRHPAAGDAGVAGGRVDPPRSRK